MATTAHQFSMVQANAQSIPVTGIRTNRRRKLSPQAGHALEKLGHAIEYLTDEYTHQGGQMLATDAPMQAVQLLMSLNRQVYMECPIVPSFGERCRSLVHACLS
jgi:hypothetical protein